MSNKITFQEVYRDAVIHPHPNLLPDGGEPEAIFNAMEQRVEDAEQEVEVQDFLHDKERDEHDDEIKALEKDYVELHTKFDKALDIIKMLKRQVKDMPFLHSTATKFLEDNND